MEKLKELQDLAIWMTGCGYDFTQHEHFLKNKHLLTLTDVSQQRKLLENFADWMDKNVNFDGIRQEEINSYIAEKIL